MSKVKVGPTSLSLGRLPELRRVRRLRDYGVKGLRRNAHGGQFLMLNFPAVAGPAAAGIFGRADHPWSAGGALGLGGLNRRIRDDAPYRW